MAKAINLIISDPVKRANLEKRYWPKVRVAGLDECWEWLKSKNHRGYGQMTCGRGITLKAHQIAFALVRHPIPEDLCVCHSCDNPGCNNPKHLFLGTNKDNSQDSVKKGRASHPPEHFGEKHHKNKFNEEVAIAIFEDNRLQEVIAKEYGISRSTVSAIKTGRNWKRLKLR